MFDSDEKGVQVMDQGRRNALRMVSALSLVCAGSLLGPVRAFAA